MSSEQEKATRERNLFLKRAERYAEMPLLGLGMVWLLLLILELIHRSNPFLRSIATVIWLIFIVDFAIKLWIAPAKSKFLKKNILTLVSLILPALRVFRIFRVVRILRATRAVRGLNMVRILGTLNRGIYALARTMKRRGFGYVLALTIIVVLAGAAGMYFFENGVSDPNGIHDYASALWWTCMIMTTMGSDYFPKTGEGRMLCLLLSIYAFAIFGYVTATVATFFIGRDAENEKAEVAGQKSINELKQEIRALREELRSFSSAGDRSPSR